MLEMSDLVQKLHVFAEGARPTVGFAWCRKVRETPDSHMTSSCLYLLLVSRCAFAESQ
jgi:hypothetical protein